MPKGFVIAIDGPAAAGKGTIVQLLTQSLHGINIYTGGMYRALALKCLQNNVDFDDKEDVFKALRDIQIDLSEGVEAIIYLDGQDVTQAIRTPEVAIGAGKVVLFPDVRKEMATRQRELVEKYIDNGKIVILDGQETATYVFPEAEMKIFLTASQGVRAERRHRQYKKQGLIKSFLEILTEIKVRDQRDWSRGFHPLSQNPEKDGYMLLDSTNMDAHETLAAINMELRKRKLIEELS